MPYGNKTGPAGFGPRTGRGLGFCNDYDSPGYTKRSFGMGLGRGYGNGFRGGGGGGRNFGRRFFGFRDQPFEYDQPVDEKGFLNSEIKALEKNLEDMKKRLEEIGKKK